MASSIPSGLLVSALFLLFAASTPAANGQSFNLTLGGQICCAPGGSCSGGAPPAVGAALALTCSPNILSQVINATIRLNGSFLINASTLPGVRIFQVLTSPCTLQVQLNQTICPQLAQAGDQIIVLVVQFIQAILTAFGILLRGIVFGLL